MNLSDRIRTAREHLRRDDIRTALDLAGDAFRLWAFEEAGTILRETLQAEDDNPEAWDLLARVLEHTGHWEEAAAADRRAARLAPEAFSAPNRISDEEMETVVQEAMDALPDFLRDLVEEVPVVLDTFPSREIAAPGDGEALPLPPDILGLFIGVPRDEQSIFHSAETPNAIFLYKGNLERMCLDRETLVEEIMVTLHHELAHYLGFDEDDMDGLGLA